MQFQQFVQRLLQQANRLEIRVVPFVATPEMARVLRIRGKGENRKSSSGALPKIIRPTAANPASGTALAFNLVPLEASTSLLRSGVAVVCFKATSGFCRACLFGLNRQPASPSRTSRVTTRGMKRFALFCLFLPCKTASQRLRLKRSIAMLTFSCDGQDRFFERRMTCENLRNRVNKVGLPARREDSGVIAMYNDADSPKSVLDGQDAGGQASGLSISATPPRFGRLAMCVAAASALVIGVMGTVAYSVWFNHDQQAYAEAMAGARRALGNGASANAAVMAKTTSMTAAAAAAVPATLPQPLHATVTSGATVAASPAVVDQEAGGQFASWSGQVKAPAAQPTVVANAANVASGTSASTPPPPASTRRPANANAAPTQQLAAARPGKDGRASPQERRAAPESARHKNNLFARMGLFFRRVSYRQHGNTNRQDIYSHP
ncbi:hypothetical protein [Paraburkholderia dipogonis]